MKEWLGADLIFDLDSDHLRGAEALDYAGQLDLVKTRLVALVDDFLFGDFGIDPASTSFVFSGGRGYHVHVRDDRFLPLSSPERRELVDYVTGTGFDPMAVIGWRRTDVRSGRTAAGADGEAEPGPARGPAPRTRTLAPPDAPGWQGRTTRALLEVLRRWEEQGSAAATEEMTGYGIQPVKARRYARLLIDQGGAAKIRAHLSLDVFRSDLPADFLEAVVPRAAVEVQGETDAPVTTDVHRLIRLPNSLHGGTGSRVVPLGRDEIAGFDPFRDALLPGDDGETTPVTYVEEARYPFPGGGVHAVPGGTDELPDARGALPAPQGAGGASAFTGMTSRPIFSIDPSTTSPGFSFLDSFPNSKPGTPPRLPRERMSPGSNVIPWERWAMISGIRKM